MKGYIYKRYYITCGSKYFCGTYTHQGYIYAIWSNKIDGKQYRRIDAVNITKRKLEKYMILGDHEGKLIEIETIERNFY